MSSMLKQFIVKRSVVAVGVSVAVAIGLVAVAIHFKRKRQKNFPPKKASKRKHRKYDTSTGDSFSSLSSARLSKRLHSRSDSFAASVASSAGSSTTSSYRRTKHLQPSNSHDYVVVEKLYKEGVNSFEAALEKWERATDILQKPDNGPHTSPGTSPTLSHSEHTALYKRFRSKKKRHRFHSVSDLHLESNVDSWTPINKPKRKNERLLSSSMGDLNDIFNTMTVQKEQHLPSFQEQLQLIVKKAKHLQETLDYVLYDENTTDSDTDMTLIGLDEHITSDSDSESTSSYMSAREFWDTRSIDSGSRRLQMYEEALVAVGKGEVACRTSRTSLLKCYSEEEYLAKLHCLRQALEVMLGDLTVRKWMIECGRSMIECILCIAGQNLEDFQEAFSNMIEYVDCNENWTEIESELKGRRVVRLSFFDIVLDFLLMDAFDDLSNPPGPVIAIMQNKWLANSLKESALYTAVWSVLKAKRTRLQYPNGFLAHMYDVSTHVTPVLAWGFLGPDGKLKEICEYFKSEVMDFLCGLFSFEHIRYTTPAQMADDILKLSRNRFSQLMNYLQNATTTDQ